MTEDKIKNITDHKKLTTEDRITLKTDISATLASYPQLSIKVRVRWPCGHMYQTSKGGFVLFCTKYVTILLSVYWGFYCFSADYLEPA